MEVEEDFNPRKNGVTLLHNYTKASSIIKKIECFCYGLDKVTNLIYNHGVAWDLFRSHVFLRSFHFQTRSWRRGAGITSW